MLEDSLARNPQEPVAHISLSEFLATYQGGDPAGLKRSFEVIEQAVKQFPDEPAVYEHLVKLYLSADRRDEARAIVSEAAKRGNRDSQYWLRLGRNRGPGVAGRRIRQDFRGRPRQPDPCEGARVCQRGRLGDRARR